MTRKDFILIASIIKEEYDSYITEEQQEQADAIKYLAISFADNLMEQNTRFDRVRFLKACGVDDDTARA